LFGKPLSNLCLQLGFSAEMPVSAVNQAVEHGEKRSTESGYCPQEPHGKPHCPVCFHSAKHTRFQFLHQVLHQ
jgi:hypothetical protein